MLFVSKLRRYLIKRLGGVMPEEYATQKVPVVYKTPDVIKLRAVFKAPVDLDLPQGYIRKVLAGELAEKIVSAIPIDEESGSYHENVVYAVNAGIIIYPND